MVSAGGSQRFSEKRPLPISTGAKSGNLHEIAVAGMAELIDVLERLQQQMGLLTEVGLTPGERL